MRQPVSGTVGKVAMHMIAPARERLLSIIRDARGRVGRGIAKGKRTDSQPQQRPHEAGPLITLCDKSPTVKYY